MGGRNGESGINGQLDIAGLAEVGVGMLSSEAPLNTRLAGYLGKSGAGGMTMIET